MVNEKIVIILNGKPRAGKDTFALILNEYIPVFKYSSVSKVKDIAVECGWRGGKSDRDRKFLSELKRLTTEYSDMAYNDILEKIEAFKKDELHSIMIIDVREPEEIARLEEATGALTVFIKNDNVPAVTSNYADANVENFDYDVTVLNDGTLDDFRESVLEFIMLLDVINKKGGNSNE